MTNFCWFSSEVLESSVCMALNSPVKKSNATKATNNISVPIFIPMKVFWFLLAQNEWLYQNTIHNNESPGSWTTTHLYRRRVLTCICMCTCSIEKFLLNLKRVLILGHKLEYTFLFCIELYIHSYLSFWALLSATMGSWISCFPTRVVWVKLYWEKWEVTNL